MNRRSMVRGSYFISAAMICVAVHAPALADVRSFDLPAAEAERGVPAFARQARIQLLASAHDLRGRRTNAVRGSYSVSDGLRQLLQGTGLEASEGSSGFTTIRRAAGRSEQAAVQSTPQVPVQPLPPQPGAVLAEAESQTAEPPSEIVVTGIRQSLERAAEIKREAVQVVDSIVAQDIGKLPDPTTAAALQRVPGVQVSVNRNNELGDVRVRGLPDILTTVNGREVFTTTGRTFDLQDMPAEALARVDVFKSQTADLIEGGLAGTIDLRLNRPFSFRKPTAVFSARGNYGQRVDRLNGQYGALLTNRWDTPVGEIGILANGTYSKTDYYRAQTILRERRSTATTPLNTPGLVIPNILQSFPEAGYIERGQFNAAIQWQVTPSLEAYAEGFYTYFRDRGAHEGANAQAFTSGVTLSDVVPSEDCITARVLPNGQNPTLITAADGTPRLAGNTVQTLCQPRQITFNNLALNQTTSARDINQRNKQIAGGLRYNQDGTRWNLDAAFQRSRYDLFNVTADVGQRIASLTANLDDGGDVRYQVPGEALENTSNLFIRNALVQDATRSRGHLFATKAEAEKDIESSFLKMAKVGLRYARRGADQYSLNINTATPGGNIGTATEATAVRVSATGLPNEFLRLSALAPDLNGGARFYVPSADYLLSDTGLDQVRGYFRLPVGRPDFQRDRQFNARETTLAAYAQLSYEVQLGDALILDGVIGTRLTQTNRTIDSFRRATAVGLTTYQPVTADTSDRDVLPNATARLRVGDGLQARIGFQKSIRRPDFTSLNPVVTLNPSNNPLVQSGGSAGNPDLRPQKSDSYDATVEYYFTGGYVSVAGYYRNITDRVITSAAVETFSGVEYAISRPRNVGEATLKGVEVSGQYFLTALPGALSGLGVQGAFTFVDSEIGGDDPLAGNPLQGVSKYNYTAGLLYEKFGLSGRLIYTYRSGYFATDDSGTPTVRPVDTERLNDAYVPTLLSYARPAGRLDFNVGYDISPAIRVDVGGTNVLKSRTRSYYGFDDLRSINNTINYDETTYTVGVRFRL